MFGEGPERLKRSQNRIVKYCHIASIILAVFVGISIIFGAATLIAAIASQVGIPIEKGSILSIITLVLLWLTTSLALWVIFCICKDITKGDSPFTKRNAWQLRILGTVLLISVAIDMIASPEFSFLFYFGDIDITTETSNMGRYPAIPINALALVFGIVCFCFSIVFDYGILLQKISDETV